MAEPTAPVLVVIPTYNERDNLETGADPAARGRAGRRTCWSSTTRSPDGTGELADELAAADAAGPRAAPRRGRTGSAPPTWPGSPRRWRASYQVVVEMDADGSHAPEDLPALLDARSTDADLVLGSRYVPGGRVVNWPAHRRVALPRRQPVLAARARACRSATSPAATGRSAAQVLEELELGDVASQGYCFQVDMAWRAVQAGFRVREVPITFTERERGASKMSQTRSSPRRCGGSPAGAPRGCCSRVRRDPVGSVRA